MPYSFPQFKRLFISKYIFIVIILTASIGVYINTLSNDFVYDDVSQIVENPRIKDIKHIPDIFLSDIWAFRKTGGSNYYRPVVHIVYMVDYYIFGLNPWGFHLSYIIFHAGVSVLVFLIAFAVFDKLSSRYSLNQLSNSYNLTLAFAASILFATHPINTEAVVLGGPEPLFAFFYLLSFYLYINADVIWGKKFILSILFFFISVLCKETALTLPLLLFVYDYSFKKEPALYLWPKAFYISAKKHIPYLITAGIYVVIRIYIIGGFAPLKRHADLSNYQYIINTFPLFAQYLEKLIFPTSLNVFHVFHPISSVFEWKGMVGFSLTIAFISLICFFRKNRGVFFSLLWILIPLLPLFYITALGENTFAERYLYLPSVGFAMLISTGINKIYYSQRLGRVAFPAVISILIVAAGLYSISTIERIRIWKDEYTLWSDAVKKSPDGYIPHHGLAIAYSKKGMLDEAIEEDRISIALKPTYAQAHTAICGLYSKKEMFDKALEHCYIALELGFRWPATYHNICYAYLRKGFIDDAIEQCLMALKLKPDFAVAHNTLGTAYFKKWSIYKAIEHYQIALRLKPDDADIRYNLGLAYGQIGEIEKAYQYMKMPSR